MRSRVYCSDRGYQGSSLDARFINGMGQSNNHDPVRIDLDNQGAIALAC